MRMIHQLGQFLTRVLLHKNSREYPLARRELEAAYKSLLGMTPSFIRHFTDTQLLELFGSDEETIVPKCYVLGSLMKEEGEILTLEGNITESLTLFLRSLSLLLTAFVMAKDEAETGHCAKIDDLFVDLQGRDIPLPILEKLFAYYELRRLYNKAEGVLFQLIDSDRGWADSGRKFYRRLLERSDDELAAGGLPRDEILRGMEKLRGSR